MDRRDWQITGLLFTLIASVYYATAAGITSSNDGSHYALVRALVDKRSVEISEYLAFTEHQDYALNGERRFSDRPPGTAFLAAPLDAVSVLLPGPLSPPKSKHDSGNARLAYTLMAPVLLAASAVALTFWVLRGYFGLSLGGSTFAAAALALGTMQWKYGSLLYSHAAAALVVMLASALMLQRQHARLGWRGHLSLGFLLGLSVLMEYTSIVFVGVAGAWWLAGLRRRAGFWPGAVAFALGGLLAGSLLMAYNTLCFGGPLELSTFNVDTTRWPQNTSFFHDFATPIWVGLPAMLFWGSDNQGLFWLAPVSALGLVGLPALWRRSRRDFGLLVGAFGAMVLLFSTSTTFNPYTNDGRYIAPFLGLWFVAVGFGVDRITGSGSAEGKLMTRPLPWVIASGLLFLSMRNQLMHIAFSWGHDLKPEQLRPWAASPDNIWAVWSAVFPNVLNLPLLWGILAISFVFWRLARAHGLRPQTPAAGAAGR